MANSHHVSHLARLAAACCVGLLGVAAAAQSPRETQKIVVDAVPVDVNYRDNTALLRDVVITQGDMRIEAAEARVKGGLDFENGEWTISGNVRIRAEGGNLSADKAVVSFRNNLISRATITGTPAEFEQLRKDGQHLARPRAHHRLPDRERHGELPRQCLAVGWLQRDHREGAVLQHQGTERAGTTERPALGHAHWRRPRAHRDPAKRPVRRRQTLRGAGKETMSVLRATHLAKSYKRRQVISDLSVEVESGQIVGLLGPNGAGKTTAFYMIVGLVPPDTGTVSIDGRDITHLAMHQRAHAGIGYLPQEASVFRKLTVEDNVLAILETRDLDETARQERLEQILAELRIAHVRKSMGMALSGGERRRVEIARALAAEPRFVLLDEPFAGVDPLSVIDIQRIMTELTAKGIGVLITDHNVRETLGVCGRAYIVSGGTVIASGTSEEILANPQVREVYLGQSFRM
jgi:lipopolysaccharide export system ATP-binding protein